MTGASNEVFEKMQRRRGSVVQGFLWILLALVLVTVVLNLLLLGVAALTPTALLPNLLFLATIAAALWFNNRQKLHAAVGLIIALTWVASAYSLLLVGVGDGAAALLLFFIPVVLAGLLLERWALWLTGLAILLVVLLTPVLTQSGMLLSGLAPAAPNWPLALQFAIVFTIVLFFLDRFGGSLQEALLAMSAREVALEQEVQERRRAEERLGLALFVARMATYDADLATGEVRDSKNLDALFGLPAASQARRLDEYLALVAPEVRERLVPQRERPEVTEHRDEFRITGEAGKPRWLATASKTLWGPGVGEGRVVGVVLDISETKAAQEELKLMNETLERRVDERTQRLEAANDELATFAYSVSHDLRSPLRGISGFSQVLLEDYSGSLDESAKSYLERIQSGARRMGGLIDDLLELSRLSEHDLERHTFDFGEIATSVADELNEGLSRPVEFVLTGEITANGDPRLLRIALTNLLGNAWKFMGDQRSPRVTFGMELAGEDTVYAVADNGTGFDMAYASKLFVPFQRLHNPTQFPGSGIGLATVQRIVHRHGGRIWATASPGSGATFSFTLGPVEPASRQP